MIPLFDAHCDTLYECEKRGCSLMDSVLSASPVHADAIAPYFQIYALFTDKGGYPLYRRLLEIGQRELTDAKHGFCYSVEGAEGLDCDAAKLPAAYAAGVRVINLCWNYDNALCGAAMDSGTGLTEQGRAFLREMERLGIFADMSHLSDASFWDIAEIAARPIIASHSNSRALCPWKRNLTDEQFAAIMKTGGVVGLNFVPDFLGLSRDVDAVIAHAEHFLALGGEKHLGLGSDFDGCTPPDDLHDLRDVEKLYNAMLRRNWPEQLVNGIFYNNFGRLFDEYTDIRTLQVF